MQNRFKSIVAGFGSVLTILTGVIVALQNMGTLPLATEGQSDVINATATIVAVLITSGYQIYSNYNNPTNKSGY